MQSFIQSNIAIFCKVIVVFFAPVQGIILLVALSTIIDTFFGIWRAKKTKIKIESKVLRHGLVPKLLSYVGAIMFVYTSDFFILNELVNNVVSIDFLSTKMIALVLISVEVKSWDESFQVVKGYSFLDKLLKILHKFKNFKKQLKDETK